MEQFKAETPAVERDGDGMSPDGGTVGTGHMTRDLAPMQKEAA